jgi:hypothetical protein
MTHRYKKSRPQPSLLLLSLMKSMSNSLWTSAFTVTTFSSNILQSLYFLGIAARLTCNLYSMMCLLTPIRSEVDHAKISLILLRKGNSSASSFRGISVPWKTALSNTLGSSTIFLVSPLASMACFALTKFFGSVEQTCC